MSDIKKILVVDDVDEVREGLASILSAEKYAVQMASNGAMAMEILNAQPVDLVITDVLMPEKDGIELVTQASREHPETGFIVISGGGENTYDYLDMSKKLTGVTMTLKKPFGPDELLDMVDHYFNDIDNIN